MSGLTLAERIVALDAVLREVPHAFGGALALAYYADPRATVDIDLNVFVPVDQLDAVSGPLAQLGVAIDDKTTALIKHDGQARVMWESTPIDLFFSYDVFHEAARAACRRVQFADGTIGVLSPEHLIVCKVVFNRSKDWVDIDAMLAAQTNCDVAEILRWVGRIVGDDDGRYNRIVAVLTRPL